LDYIFRSKGIVLSQFKSKSMIQKALTKLLFLLNAAIIRTFILERNLFLVYGNSDGPTKKAEIAALRFLFVHTIICLTFHACLYLYHK